jgi:hypothetical protein
MSQISIKNGIKEDPLEKSLSREDILKILGTVSYERAFHFYEELATPNGEFAVSLADFCCKTKKLSSKCLTFHFERCDFQNWIHDIIGDFESARRLNNIKVKDNLLRATLCAFIKSRINELKDAWSVLLVLK